MAVPFGLISFWEISIFIFHFFFFPLRCDNKKCLLFNYYYLFYLWGNTIPRLASAPVCIKSQHLPGGFAPDSTALFVSITLNILPVI